MPIIWMSTNCVSLRSMLYRRIENLICCNATSIERLELVAARLPVYQKPTAPKAAVQGYSAGKRQPDRKNWLREWQWDAASFSNGQTGKGGRVVKCPERLLTGAVEIDPQLPLSVSVRARPECSSTRSTARDLSAARPAAVRRPFEPQGRQDRA